MLTYNDLVTKLAEITYLAGLFLCNSSRGNGEKLYYKINEIHIILQNWEKEMEEENERQKQAN
jgi:hypothetical protein